MAKPKSDIPCERLRTDSCWRLPYRSPLSCQPREHSHRLLVKSCSARSLGCSKPLALARQSTRDSPRRREAPRLFQRRADRLHPERCVFRRCENADLQPDAHASPSCSGRGVCPLEPGLAHHTRACRFLPDQHHRGYRDAKGEAPRFPTWRKPCAYLSSLVVRVVPFPRQRVKFQWTISAALFSSASAHPDPLGILTGSSLLRAETGNCVIIRFRR